ncbi:MAG: hypothetical protein WDW36_003308 [Sanguina aurantia]
MFDAGALPKGQDSYYWSIFILDHMSPADHRHRLSNHHRASHPAREARISDINMSAPRNKRPREEECGSGSSGASSGATSPSTTPSSPIPPKTVQPPPTPGLVLPKLTQQTPQVEAHATFQHNGMTYREQASTANDARMFTLSGIAAPVRHAIMVGEAQLREFLFQDLSDTIEHIIAMHRLARMC